MFDALESEQYGTSFCRENGTVILNGMTVAVINENCCYRDPLGVFRTVSVEWDVPWESISYGEILIVIVKHASFTIYTPLKDVLRDVKEWFFPFGKSRRGEVTDFDFYITDATHAVFGDDTTVEDMYVKSKAVTPVS